MSNRPKFTAAILVFFLVICFHIFLAFQSCLLRKMPASKTSQSPYLKKRFPATLNLHYSLAYPEKQGISRPRATLGTIHPNNEKTSAQCQEYVKKLKKIFPVKAQYFQSSDP